jgi:20S proteasome alpha/beta subunit
LKSALDRDTASGDGVELVTITKGGFKSYSEEEIKGQLEKAL